MPGRQAWKKIIEFPSTIYTDMLHTKGYYTENCTKTVSYFMAHVNRKHKQQHLEKVTH